MSIPISRPWGGNRVGDLWVASEPLSERMGHCYFESDEATLTNGLRVSGVSGKHLSEFLPLGTMSVAVRHAGDHYNEYVPLAYAEDGSSLIPFNDLRFGAYSFGEYVGRMNRINIERVLAGLAIDVSDPNVRVPAPSKAVHLS